jgi:hypothetical protein
MFFVLAPKLLAGNQMRVKVINGAKVPDEMLERYDVVLETSSMPDAMARKELMNHPPVTPFTIPLDELPY